MYELYGLTEEDINIIGEASSENRYVAFLDILGFANLVENDPDEAWGLLSDLVAIRDHTDKLVFEFTQSKSRIPAGERVRMVTFSDTILLFTLEDTKVDLQSMISLLSLLFQAALKRCVPIRVGLAYGQFYFNIEKSMYMGPALIEAYHISKSQWLGITISQSASQALLDLKLSKDGIEGIVSWDVPYKDGPRRSYVVNWPVLMEDTLNITPPISTEMFYEAFRSTFGEFKLLEDSKKAKYENTVKFMNEQLDKRSS